MLNAGFMQPLMTTTPKAILSECAVKYAHAISNPFSDRASMSCVPLGNTRESAKVAAIYKQIVAPYVGSSITSTSGQLGIWLCPSLAYDLPVAWYYASGDVDLNTTSFETLFTASNLGLEAGSGSVPDATYKDLYDAVVNNVAGVFNLANQKLKPIYMSSLINPVSADRLVPETAGDRPRNQSRLVAYGIKVINASSNLLSGGMAVGYVHPQHSSVSGDRLVDYSSDIALKRTRLTQRPTSLHLYALNVNETDYSGERYVGITDSKVQRRVASYPLSEQVIVSGTSLTSGTRAFTFSEFGAPIAFMVLSPPVALNVQGPRFDIHIIEHLEMTGTGMQGRLTPSHRDDVGANIVLDAANHAATWQNGPNWNASIVSSIKEHVIHPTVSYISENRRAIANYAYNTALGYFSRNAGSSVPRLEF